MMQPSRDVNGAAEQSTSDSDLDRIGRVLDEYLRRMESGEDLDLNQLLARHSSIAEPLRRCLESLRLVEEALGPPSPSRDGSICVPPSNRRARPSVGTAQLGDYRIRSEIGRGGMGVVYEAEQLSLGRRVALKVLPFAAILDERQVRRFRNEAQAAAQLHHTHIVPVFSVGCERGVHYYAMQYIDGRSLDHLIRAANQLTTSLSPGETEIANPEITLGLLLQNSTFNGLPFAVPDHSVTDSLGSPVRSDTANGLRPEPTTTLAPSTRSQAYFRTVARLGREIAEALEHAHSLGVVHRDIKPSNILIDRAGSSWITDFGLARVRDASGVTLTGEVLGTLFYMSPEQASGRRESVDHRTDVYSLGVTLYELLTFTVPFSGTSRDEVLTKISSTEATPPRRLQRSVPRELETIILKALEKEPSDRYATAGLLAEDLDRFLDGRPILARRTPLLKRAVKWSLRHRSLVLTVASLVVALMTVALLFRKRADDLALENATRYEHLTLDGLSLLVGPQALRAPETLSEDGELRQRAWPADDPLQKARLLFEAAVRTVPERPEAYYYLARALVELHESGEAERVLSRSVNDFPTFVPARALLSILRTRSTRGDPVGMLNSRKEAATAEDRDEALWQHALLGFSTRAWRLVDEAYTALQRNSGTGGDPYLGFTPDVLLSRGIARMSMRDIDGALLDFGALRALWPSSPFPRILVGMAFYRAGLAERAESSFEEALARVPADDSAMRTDVVASIAHRYFDAAVDPLRGRILDRAAWEHALAWARRIPDATVRFGSMAVVLSSLPDSERTDEVEQVARSAVELSPNDPRPRALFASVLQDLGKSEEAQHELSRALRSAEAMRLSRTPYWLCLAQLAFGEKDYATARKWIEFWQAESESPSVGPIERFSGRRFVGALRLREGRRAEALESFQEALRALPKSAAAHAIVATDLRAAGFHDEALELADAAVELDADDPLAAQGRAHDLYIAGRFEEALPWAERAVEREPENSNHWVNLGSILGELRRYEEAIQAAREAIRRDPKHSKALALLAMLLVDGRGPSDPQGLEEAVRLLEKAAELDPARLDSRQHYDVLAKALASLGRTEEWFEVTRRAAGISDPDPMALYNVGVGLVQRGRTEEALPYFERAAASKDAAHPEWAHFNLGTAYLELGRPEEALAAFRQASAVEPNYPRGYSSAAKLLVQLGRVDEAISEWERAIEGHPEWYPIYDDLSVALAQSGRLSTAVRILEQAAEANPHLVGVRVRLANLLSRTGARVRGEAILRSIRPEEIAAETDPLSLDLLFAWARSNGRNGDARSYAARKIEVLRRAAVHVRATPADLNGYAWELLTCPVAELRDPTAALQAARRAVLMSAESDPEILDTLALAHFRNDEIDQAIAVEEKALANLPENGEDQNGTGIRTELERRLEEFRAAREKATQAPEGPGTGSGVDEERP